MSAKKYAKIHAEISDAKKENENKLRVALKRHIMRERERKKQLELETAKEEQARNEREARKKQDNIKTLGKTQEEIQQVEEQMIQLKNKKHQLFLQLKALITKEVEMEKIRKESDLINNARNEVGMPYQPYSNEKGVKRPHSPMTQDFYKHGTSQSQRLYLSPKTDAPGRLWYNTAKYAQSQPSHQAWPMPPSGNRYTLPSVPAPHPILINHNDQQQQQPPQLVKQHQQQQSQSQNAQPKTNSISIEKISASQQDFTIHRRLLSNGPQSNQSQQGQIVFAPSQIVYPEYIAQNRDFPNK